VKEQVSQTKKGNVLRTSMYVAVLIGLAGFLIFSILAAITFGNADLSLKDVYSVIVYKLFHIKSLSAYAEGAIHDVVWLIRLPRVLLALAVGMALSVCGVVMQAIVQNLPRAVANGQDEAARTMMAYAENVAGMAFSNAGLGMVHAMAHALGGHYNLPHGVCNAVLLPYVLAFNSRSPVCRERFMTIAAAMGLQGTFTPDTAAPAVIQFVRQLSAGVGIPANLAQLNKVDPADFAALAELALHDTCMSTNQITPTRDEVVAVYTAAFRG